MKFYNTVTTIQFVDKDYIILDNQNNQQAAMVITIQLINNDSTDIPVTFKRGKYNQQTKKIQLNNYNSTINIKTGTTILDHIVVVNPQQKYLVSSKSNKLIVSCSYGV